METKSIENLEFDKVLKKIAVFAGSNAAKESILTLKPSSSIKQVTFELNELEELISYYECGFKFSVGGIRDLREILELINMGNTVLGSEDFLKVKANLEVANQLKERFESRDPDTVKTKFSVVADRVRSMPSLSTIYKRLDSCFDEKGELRPDASPALASIKRDLVSTKNEIEKRLNMFLSDHSDLTQDRFFTLRNDRYVIPISASNQSQVQGIIHDQSATGQTVFMEPIAFLPLNNRLAQLKLSEREEVKRILIGLTGMLAASSRTLQEIFETLVHMDVLNAKARFAREYDCSRPEICDKMELELKSARHPLIHPNCIPLDIEMGKKIGCIIITGPNGGGKTVALKSLGLNALLLQTGNYILASCNSKMPVFNEILSDIGESQSIEDHLSTFTAHLKRLKELLELCDNRSLILIDEICVGTDPAEGSALATGFLKEIHRRGSFSLVTSHYDSLKHMAFVSEGFSNAAMEFDYETFKPTFRFQMGIPGKSNALAIARSFELPEAILKELDDLDKAGSKDEAALLEAIERERNRAEALRRTYVQKIASMRQKEAEIESTMAQLQEFRRKKRDKLTEEYAGKLKAKLKEFESLISGLKKSQAQDLQTQKNEAKESELQLARKAHQDVRNTLTELRDIPDNEYSPGEPIEDISTLNIGEMVLWAKIMQKGKITRIDSGRKKVELDFDGKSFLVPLSELSPAPHKNSKKEKKERTGSVYAPSQFVRDEIDLRGLRLEEAIERAETYLKVAESNGLGKVYLIHGKGTGALQRGINEFLRSGPYRKKFRPGKYGEGDMGVTVVVFKSEADEEKPDELRIPKKPYRKKGFKQK